MNRVDSLRFEYTWQRHIRKGPTTAVFERLQAATHADLRYAAKARKRLAQLAKRKAEHPSLFDGGTII